MTNVTSSHMPEVDLAGLVGQRAGNLFESFGLCCSEAVLMVMNQGFGGGVDPGQLASMGAGFCEGMGGAGCTCGSLGGAVMGLGLFLGPHLEAGGLRKKDFRKLVKEMHDRFRERFNATCCRVLTKKVKHDRKMQFDNCKMLTVTSAELVTELLLEARPELEKHIDMEFILRHDSKMAGKIKKIFGKV